MTHDYKRNGTASLFAALEVLTGRVTGICQSRHRHQEFIRFLNHFDEQYEGDHEIHVIMDNSCNHGQLWDTQTTEGRGLAQAAFSIPSKVTEPVKPLGGDNQAATQVKGLSPVKL